MFGDLDEDGWRETTECRDRWIGRYEKGKSEGGV